MMSNDSMETTVNSEGGLVSFDCSSTKNISLEETNPVEYSDEESLASDSKWALNKIMTPDLYWAMHENLRDIIKEKDLDFGGKVLYRPNRKMNDSKMKDSSPVMDLAEQPFIITDLTSDKISPSSSSTLSAEQEIETEIHSKPTITISEAAEVRTLMNDLVGQLKLSTIPQSDVSETSSLADETKSLGLSCLRHIRRIDNLTDLLHRTIRLGNYLGSILSADVPSPPEILQNFENGSYRPPTIRELESKFIRSLSLLINEPSNSERLEEMAESFRTCVSNMEKRLHVLVDISQCDDLFLKDKIFFSDEQLVLEDLRKYLPKFWEITHHNNMLMKHWISSLLNFVIRFQLNENLQHFYNLESRVYHMKDQIPDINKSATRLLRRMKDSDRKKPEMVELLLITTVTNIASILQNSLSSEILLIRCHLGNRIRTVDN